MLLSATLLVIASMAIGAFWGFIMTPHTPVSTPTLIISVIVGVGLLTAVFATAHAMGFGVTANSLIVGMPYTMGLIALRGIRLRKSPSS